MKVGDILSLRQAHQGEEHSAVVSISSQRPVSPSQSTPSQQEAPADPRTLHQELEAATPPRAALDICPDWQGLLVRSSVLELLVWVVRSRQDGVELAKETGHPALLLDDVLHQKGKTREEAREALLPVLIASVQ